MGGFFPLKFENGGHYVYTIYTSLKQKYARLSAPTSKERGIIDGWFANKSSLSMGASTHVISGIDFSKLKPDPSLHRWQQMH